MFALRLRSLPNISPAPEVVINLSILHSKQYLTLKAKSLTTLDILCFSLHLYNHDNQLLNVKYAFNFKTLIYVGT